MGYTPLEQHLEPGIEDLLGAVDKLTRAINERIAVQNEWTAEHIDEIVVLKNDLALLEVRLRRLQQDTP